MSWVKFHEELTQGSKRAIPRSARFVFLELSLKCRPGRGRVEIRNDVPDVEAVCDLLGGTSADRREIAKSIATLVSRDVAMLDFDSQSGRRWLVIRSWEVWNEPDTSTERMRKHREKKRSQVAGDASRDVTGVTPHVTPSVTCDGPRGEGEESKREINPPKPPLGGAVPSAPEIEPRPPLKMAIKLTAPSWWAKAPEGEAK